MNITNNRPEDDFEAQLREALTRAPAPDGFAGKVLERVTASRRQPRWRAPLAVAAAVLVAIGAVGWQRLEEQRRAEEAKRQLMLALEITSEKLSVVNQVLNRSTH